MLPQQPGPRPAAWPDKHRLSRDLDRRLRLSQATGRRDRRARGEGARGHAGTRDFLLLRQGHGRSLSRDHWIAALLPEALGRLEVVDLLGRAIAAEHLVSMREAAEAGDDVAMLDRMLVILLVAQRGEQRAAELLVAEVLAVLERHEE